MYIINITGLSLLRQFLVKFHRQGQILADEKTWASNQFLHEYAQFLEDRKNAGRAPILPIKLRDSTEYLLLEDGHFSQFRTLGPPNA